MKILIRTFNPLVSGKGGQILAKPRWSGEYWSAFESILIGQLKLRGHEVVIQLENVTIGDQIENCDLAIYAHRNQKDINEKTIYSYPKYATATKRLFYMMMHVSGWFQIDHEGWGANNSSVNLPVVPSTEATDFINLVKNDLISNNNSKISQPPASQIKHSDYILILSQLENDYTIRYQSPIKITQMILAVHNWAKSNKVKVILKRHPLDLSDEIGGLVVRLKNDGLIESKDNVHSLISSAKAVYVVNSGTGFESLLHQKPVVTFGSCDYKRATFPATLENLNEAWQWINEFSSIDANTNNEFLYWYYTNFIFNSNNQNKCAAKIAAFLDRNNI